MSNKPEKPIKVKRIPSGDEHVDQKWIVLEASKGPVTKRRAIDTASLYAGQVTLAQEKAKLIADVEEYHGRYLAVQAELENLND
jgi:hypothetical protein